MEETENQPQVTPDEKDTDAGYPGGVTAPAANPGELRGPGPNIQDFPPPSDVVPPQAAQGPDAFGREGTAKNYPPGAPDTPEGPLSHDEVRQLRESGVDLEPKPHPSEVNPNPPSNRPPESELFPDMAQRRSDEMQGIPSEPQPGPPQYIPGPAQPQTWVPPSDRPVPGDWAKERSIEDVPDTLRKLAAHLREKKAVASAAPFSIEEEVKVLEGLADFVEGELGSQGEKDGEGNG
jgi:hypothetical protein